MAIKPLAISRELSKLPTSRRVPSLPAGDAHGWIKLDGRYERWPDSNDRDDGRALRHPGWDYLYPLAMLAIRPRIRSIHHHFNHCCIAYSVIIFGQNEQ